MSTKGAGMTEDLPTIHGSRELNEDAAKLEAMGTDPGPDFASVFCCHWTMYDNSEFWETDCGECFSLKDGMPEQNRMKFCWYCGAVLLEAVGRNN